MSNQEVAADPPRKSPRRWIILGVVVLIVAIGAFVYWFYHRNYESTDDAFIDGNVTQIGPRVAGTVTGVFIRDNEKVKKGELLVQLDPRDYQVRVNQARAALDAALARQATARADLALARITTDAAVQEATAGVTAAGAALQQAQARASAARAESERARSDAVRYRKLFTGHNVSHQQLDQAITTERSTGADYLAARRAIAMAHSQQGQAQAKLVDARSAPQQIAVKEAQLKSADAAVEQARAALRQTELKLSYTKIYAPEAGRITDKSIEVGDQVQMGQHLIALVLGQRWVTANFKETQLADMHPGQPVDIQVDAYPDHPFHGHVDSIQAGTGARFSLLPAENATGNYVKVVQRVPVKIVFDRDPDASNRLSLGMSVVPRVNVAAGSGTPVRGNVRRETATDSGKAQ